MKPSIDFWSRILGAVVFGILGGILGSRLAELLNGVAELNIVVLSLVGVLAGLILTPYLTIRPLRRIRHRLLSLPPESLVAIVLGTFLGLAATALISGPLSLLPDVLSQVAPLVVAVILIYLSVTILVTRQHDLWSFFSNFSPLTVGATQGKTGNTSKERSPILLDTSVIIDGRIVDICNTGFMRGTLLVPNFVLQELQNIADSPDPIRRNRGRRGMEVLRILQKESVVPIRITDMDISESRDVDQKLILLARHLACPIMTNDYNLNRVAELQGIPILNINELANAVKAAYLPGEELAVKVIQAGREEGQGVGYLEDGTMVVIEDSEDRIDQEVGVIVTKTLQTSAGRMIFARPQEA